MVSAGEDGDAAQYLIASQYLHDCIDTRAGMCAGKSHAQREHHGAYLHAVGFGQGFNDLEGCIAAPVLDSVESLDEVPQHFTGVLLQLSHVLLFVLQHLHPLAPSRYLAEQLHLGLHGGKKLTQLSGVLQPGGGAEGHGQFDELVGRQAHDVLLVHPLALRDVELGGSAIHILEREEVDELLLAENFVIALAAPTEQGYEVNDGIGQEPFLRVIAELSTNVALAHLGAVRVLDEGDVGVHGRLHAKGVEKLQVLEGVHDVILAADDVRNLHLDVVHHVDKVEDVGAVRTLDYHVGGVFLVGVVHGDIAAYQVVQRHYAIAFEAETPHRAFAGAGNLIAVFVALIGGRALVHAPHLHQFVEIAVVNILSLALEVGFTGATLSFTFVPIQPEPAHAGENGLHGVFHVALLVGVFNAQNEGTTHFTGKKVIEQSGARATDVQIAGGRRGKTCANRR